MEAPIKSEVFCSSFMHFWFAFGGAICQVINAECSILCFVFHADNSFLACKLAINQLVEQRHRLNLRYFAHLLCIFCLPLVELFARLLMLSVRWCFTCFVSLLCFCFGSIVLFPPLWQVIFPTLGQLMGLFPVGVWYLDYYCSSTL